jgi:hypothetical protein
MNDIRRAWYREPMVWLVIAFPLTSIVVGITLLVIAERTHDGLVQDDYYKKGKEINLTLARDEAAARAGLRAELKRDGNAQRATAVIAASGNASPPAEITLRWLHATRSGFDRTQTLKRESGDRFVTAFPELAPGHWYVQMEAQDWRLVGSLRVPQDTQVSLRPSPVAGGPAP